MLSAGTRYGLRALLFLAKHETAGYVPIHTISELLRIPRHYLAKVLKELVQHGILISIRGANGGVALARPADEIVLIDILQVFDEMPIHEQCLLDLPGCSSPAACQLDERWQCACARTREMFDHTTLAEAARRLARANEQVPSPDQQTSAP